MRTAGKSSDRRLRLGIIGGGKVFEKLYLPALCQIDVMSLIAVYEASEERRQWLRNAVTHGVIANGERDFWRSGPFDLVLVATPPEFHCHYSCKAVENGAHVLVEKPMALSVADGLQMMAAAGRTEKKIWVGFQRRFRDAFLNLKRELGEMRQGHPSEVRYEMILNPRGWQSVTEYLGEDRRGGGVFDDVFSHQANLLAWLFGSRVEKVSAASAQNKEVTDTLFDIELTMNDGLKIHCIAGHGRVYRERITVGWQDRLLTANGSILLHCGRLSEKWVQGYGRAVAAWRNFTSKVRGRPNMTTTSMIRELRAIGAEIRGRPSMQPRPAGGEEGLDSIRVVDACRRSWNSGGEVLQIAYEKD